MKTTPQPSQLDEIDEIQRCLSAVTDLLAPCQDMHIVNRDNLAMLIGYFSKQLKQVTDKDRG